MRLSLEKYPATMCAVAGPCNRKFHLPEMMRSVSVKALNETLRR